MAERRQGRLLLEENFPTPLAKMGLMRLTTSQKNDGHCFSRVGVRWGWFQSRGGRWTFPASRLPPFEFSPSPPLVSCNQMIDLCVSRIERGGSKAGYALNSGCKFKCSRMAEKQGYVSKTLGCKGVVGGL